MRPITLDLDPQGRRILSCACGTIEIARANDWQEFTIEALDHDLARVTCDRCDRQARLGLDVEPSPSPQPTW
ncbi:hypothetical protein BOX17_14655 [Halomonas aestuarii]|uniref:Uncharacterized protein n=1 Tax=Halomonas aestuarii TaxID=1897729 RepID=A0A1J0VJ81_9GAMM|nr:hypothetical protein [Halomonas aestuarii]APE32083.1 hypothetical protein BOX17_14655 [Halomonas aestuarii]